jgi:hypothetical protein
VELGKAVERVWGTGRAGIRVLATPCFWNSDRARQPAGCRR